MMKTLLFGFVLLGMACGTNAATLYQTAGHAIGESWDTASKWSDESAPAAGNVYINDLGESTRTPSDGGTFAGDSLTLGEGSILILKNGSSYTSVDLILEDGTSMAQGGGSTAKITGTLSGAGSIELNTSTSTRSIQLDAQILSGNTISSVIISGAGTVNIANATNAFFGVWTVEDGTLKGDGFGDGDFQVESAGILDFDSNFFSTNSTLVVEDGGQLLLDQSVVLYSADLWGETLEVGTYTCAELKTNALYGSAIHSDSSDSASLTVTLGALESLSMLEAEDMTLSGYAAEENSDASGGELVRLSGSEGSAKGLLAGFEDGYFDLNVGYFDETDGCAAFKVYLNNQLLESWLATRCLGSSDPESINFMERTIPRVYLSSGDLIEVFGQSDGGEGACIDYVQFSEASAAGEDHYMTWASDGTISNLVLNGVEHLDASESSGVTLRQFNGWTLGESAMILKDSWGSVVDLEHPAETFKRHMRGIFRMDAQEHHLALRLLDVVGIPPNDASQSLRLEIPYLSSLGYQALDTNIELSVSGNVLTVDWPYLASRDLMAGGQIALYAEENAEAAQAEIEQLYTNNGKLDPYYEWADDYFSGTNADLWADPDDDGINNLSEYAWGGNPIEADAETEPSCGTSGEQFVVQYTRRLDAEDCGLTYTVETTENLVDGIWTTHGVVDAGSGILDADFEVVTNSISTIGQSNAFLKVVVEFEK
jgi:hypothetical protein